jgi:hypothetical protein
MRKRKVFYPPKKGDRPAPRAGADERGNQRSTAVTIDLTAGRGRAGLSVGSRVRITGTGLYTGELATVESVPGGVIPAAMVRTDAGRTRRVRTIDLEIVQEGAEEAPAQEAIRSEGQDPGGASV